MKKRILYILLGVMLLSVEGVGQYSFSLATGSNTKPLYNCNDVTFDYSNTSGQTVRLYIFYKLNSSDAYTQIPGYFNVSNGASSNYGNSSSGFYKAEFKNATGTSTLYASSEYEVEIRPTPSSPVITSNTPICEGATLTFNTTAVSGGTFSWTGVNGFLGTGIAPSITNATAASTGNYSATVTVDGCTSAPSNTLSTTVNTRPTVNITSPNTTICYNDLVSVNMNVTAFGTCTVTLNDGGIVTGLVSGVNPFVKRPTVTTEYHIISAVDQNCPSAASDLTGSITVSVDALSAGGTIAGSTTVCTGTNSATLTLSGNTGSITKWQSSTDAVFTTPADILTTTSSYSVSNLTSKLFYRAVVKNGVCAATNSSNADVSVDALSVGGTIAGSTTVCSGTNSATLTLSGNTGSVTKWQSSTDAVFTTPADILTTTSSYSVSNLTSKLFYRAVVKNGVCAATNSSNADVSINPLPAKPTLTSQTICEGATATITGPTGTYTYTWQVPTGVATSTTKSVITSKAGTYSLTITDANSCASEVGTGIVTVNPLPAKPTLTSPKICEGETASVTMLTPTGTNTYTYIWTVPTGVATSTTKSVSTSKAGTYSLTITDANSCTSEVGIGTVTVNPLPAKPTLTSPKICEGETASVTMLTPTGTNTYTYIWTVPTGVATSTTKTLSTSKAGTYSLTIMDANSCTSEVGTGTVVVNALPPKPILTSSVICEGETATVTMSTPTGTITYTYTWQVPTGVATSTTNTVSTNKAGNYSLNIMDANSCNSEVGTATVVVNALPAKPTVTSPTICEGQTATITSPSGVYTYTWQVPDGVLAPGNVNTFTTTKAGTYSLSIINNKGCNSAVGSGVVSVNAIPAAPSISSNSPVEEGQTLNLTASNIAGAIYAWSGPNGFASIRQNPSITGATPANSGTYYATVSLNGCTSVSSLPINILVNAKVLTSPVFQIPNAFTPNSDGHNDTFKIIQNGYVTSILSFRIFTKSGKLIFSDKDGAWDGRYQRVMQDADVYIWIADFINKNNVTEHLSGTVLLLK